MRNEFGNIKSCTNNYANHKNVMSEMSIADVCRAVDYINALSNLIDTDNEIQDIKDEVLEPLYNMIVELRVEDECPHCGMLLYKSDLPQYDFVCPMCNENF